MNDSGSVLLATSVLALSGLGLYMFSMTHDDEEDGNKHSKNKDNDIKNENNDEETIFDTSSLFSWGASDDNQDNVLDNEREETETKPRKKTTTKTQRNRKSIGSSRRRY
jgi:hypothetical protein